MIIPEARPQTCFSLRKASEVMTPERLGASRITCLSFSRSMIRKVMGEKWKINRIQFDLDEQGVGEACYSIETNSGTYYFVVFTHQIDDLERSDRVIAEKWDVTFALCEGPLTEEKKARLREGLPRQEAGRGDAMDLVWSRANRSSRVFNYVVEKLAAGEQPDPYILAQTGYLLRTTAVYGNGKFGIASYEKIKENHPFNGSFRAQMFAVWMIREFSFQLVEHIARAKNPHAACLHPKLKRFLGIGNATGLGMIPFLISHPKLLHNWMYLRETGIARVMKVKASREDGQRLLKHVNRCISYFRDFPPVEGQAFTSPDILVNELNQVKELINEFINQGTINQTQTEQPWLELYDYLKKTADIETQELVLSLLTELYPEMLEDLQEQTSIDECYDLIPDMRIKELKHIISTQYDWAFQYDFTDPDERKYFWYRSVEKEEPRIGERGIEPGEEHELPVNIAEQVQRLAKDLEGASNTETVASFVIRNPKHKWIIRRIQSLKDAPYGEIHGNLLSKNFLPIHLMRCKLAFFGAERFDPKSNRWVRVTLFQGAPLVEDIGKQWNDDWIYPEIPRLED